MKTVLRTAHRGRPLLILMFGLGLHSGCDRADPVDAGTTRAFWADVRRAAVPLDGSSDAQLVIDAADAMDRLSPRGVDPKVVAASREAAVLYRRFGKFMAEAAERGQAGTGLHDRGEVESLAAESDRVAKRLTEVDAYMRATYQY